MPTLGTWLRRVRDDRGLTRQQAAERSNISVDYINKIDRGSVPTRDMVDKLITTYDMNPRQARHTRHLWAPPAPLASIDELRERVDTPSRREALAHMDKIGMICVYTDPLWNVLTANQSFRRALPGLEEARDNVALWMFCICKNFRPAMNVTLQWDQEALFHTAILRGAFGLYRTSPRAKDLFDRLMRDPDFKRMWDTSLHVTYARNPNDLAYLRDPASGEPYSLSIDIAELADIRDIRVCHAFRQPHSGSLTLP